ncbi:hypothetical protein ACQRWP_29470 [Micromonospora trifolii]|uniref:hypothetical protein n=1 Tax=Micromonospora trifolii TaxID=2911208 RepID=UPI003D2EB6C7
MNISEEMRDYLEDIDVTVHAISRITKLFQLTAELLPAGQEIRRIFISETMGEEGRIYGGAWFFTSDCLSEAHNFMTPNEFIDFYSFKNNFALINVKKNEFEFGAADTASRMRLKFMGISGSAMSGVTGELKASGKNCDYLYRITKEIFIPNTLFST